MKIQSETSLFTRLTETDMINLGKTVEETLADDLVGTQTKKFRSVDLWKIQRKKKSIVIR